MCACFGSEFQNVSTDKITQFFTIDCYFAFIDWQSLKKSSSPIIDMFVSQDQFYRVNLCFRKIQFLVTDDFFGSEFVLKVQENICVWFFIKSFHDSIHVFLQNSQLLGGDTQHCSAHRKTNIVEQPCICPWFLYSEKYSWFVAFLGLSEEWNKVRVCLERILDSNILSSKTRLYEFFIDVKIDGNIADANVYNFFSFFLMQSDQTELYIL